MTYYKGQLYYVDQSIQYLIWYLAKEFDQINDLRVKSNLTLKQAFTHIKIQGYIGTFKFANNTNTHLYGAIQYYDEQHIRLLLGTDTKKPLINDVIPASFRAIYSIYAKEQRDLLVYQLYDELNYNKHLYFIDFDPKKFISKSTNLSALTQYASQLKLNQSRKHAYQASQVKRKNFYKAYHKRRYSDYKACKTAPIKRLLSTLNNHIKRKQAYSASQTKRKFWHQAYHEARWQRHHDKKQALLSRIQNQVRAIYHPKQVKTQYRINTHNKRYDHTKKQLITHLSIDLNKYAQKRAWLDKQKQNLKPFPLDTQDSGLNFENLDLFQNQHKIIYLFLGQDKNDEFIAKVGRSINLSGREYLYSKTVLGSKDNLFKPYQTILLINHLVDDQDTWTFEQFYALEAFYIHQFKINNCIKKPREWLFANSVSARNKLQNIFDQTTNLITTHPELLTYFHNRNQGKYGIRKLTNDFNKYSLSELLTLANSYTESVK